MLAGAPKPCWACRKGRLICDFTKPACRKCQTRGTECPGYDAKPLVWIPNGTVKAKRRKNEKAQVLGEPKKQVEAEHEHEQEQEHEHEREHVPAKPPKSAQRQTEPREPSSDPKTSTDVVEQPARLLAKRIKLKDDLVILSHEIIEYLNVRISPNAVAASDGPTNPYRFPHEVASYLPFSMLYTLSCVALGHRIFQLPPGDHRTALTMRFQEHRGTAIRAISSGIQSQSTQINDETLFGVLSFLLAEVSGPQAQTVLAPQLSVESRDSSPESVDDEPVPPSASSWRQHVDGAGAIIEMRGGLPELVVTRPSLKPLLTYFIVVDVMSGTTSPPLTPKKARRQLEILSVLPMIYGDGLLTSSPCPPELFALIIRINHLRSVLNATPVPAESFMPAITELLDQVTSFSPDLWAAKTAASQALDSSSSRIEELDAIPEPARGGGAAGIAHSKDFLSWRRLAMVYKASTALYCILSLIGLERHIPDSSKKTDPVDLTAFFQRTLFQNLKELCIARETKSDQMRRLVMWPLAIAGTQMGKGNGQMKDLVRCELKWLSVELGTSTPLVIQDFLGRVWTQNSQAEGQRTGWDTMFDTPYAFAV